MPGQGALGRDTDTLIVHLWSPPHREPGPAESEEDWAETERHGRLSKKFSDRLTQRLGNVLFSGETTKNNYICLGSPLPPRKTFNGLLFGSGKRWWNDKKGERTPKLKTGLTKVRNIQMFFWQLPFFVINPSVTVYVYIHEKRSGLIYKTHFDLIESSSKVFPLD